MKSKYLFLSLFFALILVTGCAKKKEQSGETKATDEKLTNVSEISNFEKRSDLAPNFSWIKTAKRSRSIPSAEKSLL
jgi:hypothetical protein